MKKCIFYVEVKDLKIGDSKIFQCPCKRHKEQDIVVICEEFTATWRIRRLIL